MRLNSRHASTAPYISSEHVVLEAAGDLQKDVSIDYPAHAKWWPLVVLLQWPVWRRQKHAPLAGWGSAHHPTGCGSRCCRQLPGCASPRLS